MSEVQANKVTLLLDAAASGDRLATERLFPVVYGELRRMAAALMGREQGAQTLQPTALVNEAFLRLIGPRDVGWESRAHFFGAAAQAMRRILIDRARHVKAARVPARPMDSTLPMLDSRGGDRDRAADDLLGLDGALEDLRGRDERQHQVVMLRFFAGLTSEQTALAMGLSASTVKNEWTYARAWLLREIERRRAS
ncbi:MAG: sigma-70 family RNA polymerase sigma factor [Phycisphaerales bacterium]|nr:sigma-70 family RNA polymerase sigma factor [Phycisphaerales bacterium]